MHHASIIGSKTVLAVFACAIWLLLLTTFRHFYTTTSNYAAPVHHASAAFSQHPIEELILQARQAYNETIRRQSKTFEAAVATYRARYKRQPPPDFDKWFDFAQSRRSPIIDEFDTINDAIAPLLKISGARINEMIDEAHSSNSALYKCGYRKGEHYGYCGRWDPSWYMAPIEYLLPDVEFLMSDLDEPRVLPDPVTSRRTTKVTFLDYSHLDVRNLLWNPCSSSTTQPHVENNLPFITSTKLAKDLCRNPSYANLHGFSLSPSTLWATRSTPPILSTAKPPIFGDILYPNPTYAEDYYDPRVYSPDRDLPWSSKHNSLYWSGDTSGGYFNDSRWQHSHRQRFVGLTNGLMPNTSTPFLCETSPGVWTSYTSTDMLPGLFTTAFTEISSSTCGGEACTQQRALFPTTGRRPPNEAYSHRFIMDLDGWSFSRNFYTHLRSRSLPFKQTIFSEWHDDRLWAWVHYVPVSLGMRELPEMVRWFALSKDGTKYAREIAEEGREWWGKALRKEDMQVYMYRLILEYRRLRDAGRPAMG